MARRHPHPARTGAVSEQAEDWRRKVEWLIEKGDVKEAFKQAKYHFHQEASPENHQLVERTYLLRIQALLRGGMDSAAREVAGSLLEFGVTDAAVRQNFVLLLPRVGLADKAQALSGAMASPEVQAKLLIKLVDRAVAHPKESGTLPAELRDAVQLVHRAFAALDADQGVQALELLQSIPRNSPLADWRYFLRGLSAFRKQDRDQARANWERLDPDRSAEKVAQVLLAASDLAPGDDRIPRLHAMELCAYGEPVLERLGHLRRVMEAGDWKRALQLVGPLRKSLLSIDPRYAQRLTEAVLPLLSVELMRNSSRAAERQFKDFAKVLEPLSWDPHWNRFQALLWEGSQGDLKRAIDFWKKYVKDLAQGAASELGDSPQIQALVWRRIGMHFESLANEDEFWADKPADEVDFTEGFRRQAVEALQQSLRLDPAQRRTYELLIEIYQVLPRPDRVVEALTHLLEAFPDDVKALRQLMEVHQRLDQPEQMLTTLERLRVLRPLDSSLPAYETWARLARARHLAWNGRWDEGRAEFARIETTVLREQLDRPRLLSRRAAFEFKAGHAAQAEEFIQQARSAASDPAVMCLSLAIEAVRYKLTKPLQKRFDQEFKSALTGKVVSATAGGLAEMMLSYLVGDVTYVGRAGHLKEIVRFVRRTDRMNYAESDLRHVCLLLHCLGKETKLLTTMTRRGRKRFPRSPFFIHMEVSQELAKGPYSFRAESFRKKLHQALAAAESSQNPADIPLVEMIKETLARVDDLEDTMSQVPFPPGMPSGMPNIFQEMMDTLFDQFDQDDDSAPPPRKGRSRRPR